MALLPKLRPRARAILRDGCRTASRGPRYPWDPRSPQPPLWPKPPLLCLSLARRRRSMVHLVKQFLPPDCLPASPPTVLLPPPQRVAYRTCPLLQAPTQRHLSQLPPLHLRCAGLAAPPPARPLRGLALPCLRLRRSKHPRKSSPRSLFARSRGRPTTSNAFRACLCGPIRCH